MSTVSYMNLFLRTTIFCLIFATSHIAAFWASGDEPSTKSGTGIKTESVSEKKESERKIPRLIPKKIETQDKESEEDSSITEINRAIIQLYKLQWNKILNELESSFEEFYEDDATRSLAYKQIQTTYITLKKKTQNSDTSENTKIILVSYFEYMIGMLEKKINELSK